MSNDINVFINPSIFDSFCMDEITFESEETKKYLMEKLTTEIKILLKPFTKKVNVNDVRAILASKGIYFCF